MTIPKPENSINESNAFNPEVINTTALQRYRELDWVRRNQRTGIPQLLEEVSMSPERYDEHGVCNLAKSIGIIDIIAGNTGINTTYPGEVNYVMHEGMIPAIISHDLAFQRPDGKRGNAQPVFDNSFIERYVALAAGNDGIEAAATCAAGLCYAASVKGFENKGREWNRTVLRTCNIDGYFDLNDPINKQFLDLMRMPGYEDFQFNITNIKDMVRKSLTNPNADVPDILFNYRAPLANASTNIEAVVQYDLEGLLIKAAEVIYYVRNHHQGEKQRAKDWCRAQELVSYYGPMLETAGFRGMSDLCYSTANEYLYRGSPETLARAKQIHDRAAADYEEFSPGMVNILQDLPGFTVDGYRLKKMGNIAHKLGRYPQKTAVPDLMAVMITADHTYHKSEEMYAGLAEVVAALKYKLGCEIGNPNEQDPAIDIKWNDLGPSGVRRVELAGVDCDIVIQPRTVDGYEGINVSAITPHGTSFEVQVHDQQSAEERDGLANHAFYNMAKNSPDSNLANLRKAVRDAADRVGQCEEGSVEYASASEAYGKVLRKFNAHKANLLNLLEKQVKRRVDLLSNPGMFPKVNPVILDRLISDPLLSGEAKGLLSNLQNELSSEYEVEP